jgi:serine protease Do
MKRQAFLLVGLTAVVGFLLGLVASGPFKPGVRGDLPIRLPAGDSRPLSVSIGASTEGGAIPAAGVDFSVVAARLNAAVVNVDAASRGSNRAAVSRVWPADDPSTPREGAGSGFVIDPAGYILTNYHVVEGADRVTVTLGDGRVFRASVVGLDPAIDVALLQVSASAPLPVAPLGDSDSLRVGEWVCAIGNPLGYVHSVTVGVVSFLGRKVFDPLDAFIQTDAGITFGNSGGPLINTRGQVVGITTAISAQSATIGFAVPIGQVIAALPQLKERGRVSRGSIGAGLTDVTPELRQALRVEPAQGALVQDVGLDSPAEQAGLRPYDVVVAADGEPIRSEEALTRHISMRQPGTFVALDVWRDGARRVVPVKLRERPAATSPRAQNASDQARRASAPDYDVLGLIVNDIDAVRPRRPNIPDSIGGVLVTGVDLAGPAHLAGIQNGQVVLEINRRRVASLAVFRQILQALKPGDAVAVLVYDPRNGQRTIRSIRIDV